MRVSGSSQPIAAVCFFALALGPAQAQSLLQAPEEATIADSHDANVSVLPPFNATLGLHKCVITPPAKVIVCYFVLTSHKSEPTKYTANPKFWASTLLDNNHTEHQQSTEYFRTGSHGKTKQNSVMLSQDDSVWFVQEFGGDVDDVRVAKIAFNLPLGYGEKFSLKVDVENTSAE